MTMETIAVYWEAKIRTYGFHLSEGLRLCQIGVAPADLGLWGQALHSMADHGPAFQLVWAQSGPWDQVRFFLLCDNNHWSRVNPFLEGQTRLGIAIETSAPSRVDLLFFQGPHYGDRYGVLDFALAPLVQAQVPLLAVACSVATIYLVMPSGWGRQAKTILTAAFEIPCKAGA